MIWAGLEMPPWNLWPPILQGVAEVIHRCSGPALIAAVLLAWRREFCSILLSTVALIDRATYMKLFGVILKAPEAVRPLPAKPPELSTGKKKRGGQSAENLIPMLKEHVSRPKLAHTLPKKIPLRYFKEFLKHAHAVIFNAVSSKAI